MNPVRVDFVVDLLYGGLLLIAFVLILAVGTDVGIAFGAGVLVAYVVHVTWKMARFNPDWMTVAVTETVEETLSEELDEVIEQVDEVHERIDRRPKTDDVEEMLEGEGPETAG